MDRSKYVIATITNISQNARSGGGGGAEDIIPVVIGSADSCHSKIVVINKTVKPLAKTVENPPIPGCV